jgi:UDP-N-acetylmuramoyl-L-alanyl-D-glutamate--2,6-diaminopimelate ligase
LLKLNELLDTDVDLEISGIAMDSRVVKPGYLFVALRGSKSNGINFIDEALSRGAKVILTSKENIKTDSRAIFIEDKNPRQLLSLIASRFYSCQPKVIVAVTGTNGKTSVVNFISQIWTQAGLMAASIGTIGMIEPDNIFRSCKLTTPDPITLHFNLDRMKKGGITHVALEASSHGINQFRLDGVDINVSAFTNLTQDHLDYHNNMKAYMQAKSRLFNEIMPKERIAIINIDSQMSNLLIKLCKNRDHLIITYGNNSKADIRLNKVTPVGDSQNISIVVMGTLYKLNIPIAGTFQISNIACALGLALATGIKQDVAVATLEKLHGVPGRMQKVTTTHEGAQIYVDYAHTPDGLENLLKALRLHVKNRLLLVFGCGGNRDIEKRSKMGNIAKLLADQVFVTDDNPRNENPATIRAQIIKSCPDAIEVENREDAIRLAINSLKLGDLLVIAGKGHETVQIIEDRIIPFDDVKQVRRIITERI